MQIADLNIIMSLVLNLIGYIGINVKILILSKFNKSSIDQADIDNFQKYLDDINLISKQILNSIKIGE